MRLLAPAAWSAGAVVVLVLLVARLLLALGAFYLALVDLVYFFGLILDYGNAGASLEAIVSALNREHRSRG